MMYNTYYVLYFIRTHYLYYSPRVLTCLICRQVRNRPCTSRKYSFYLPNSIFSFNPSRVPPSGLGCLGQRGGALDYSKGWSHRNQGLGLPALISKIEGEIRPPPAPIDNRQYCLLSPAPISVW